MVIVFNGMRIETLLETEWSGSRVYIMRYGWQSAGYLFVYEGRLYLGHIEMLASVFRWLGYWLGLFKDPVPASLIADAKEILQRSAFRSINKLKSLCPQPSTPAVPEEASSAPSASRPSTTATSASRKAAGRPYWGRSKRTSQ